MPPRSHQETTQALPAPVGWWWAKEHVIGVHWRHLGYLAGAAFHHRRRPAMPVNGSPQQIRNRQALADPTWVVVDECKSKLQVPEVQKCPGKPFQITRVVGDDCERLVITTDSNLRRRLDEMAIHAVAGGANRA